MKRLSRDFTRGEKVLLLLLALVLVGLAYYFIVDRPVRSALESAKAEKEALVTELTTLQARIARMEKMQAELDALQANPEVSKMGSYNNSKAELDFIVHGAGFRHRRAAAQENLQLRHALPAERHQLFPNQNLLQFDGPPALRQRLL